MSVGIRTASLIALNWSNGRLRPHRKPRIGPNARAEKHPSCDALHRHQPKPTAIDVRRV
jgi:hypothetical protein